MRKNFYYTGLYFVQGMRLLWRNRFWSLITAIVVSAVLSMVYVMAALSAHTTEAAHKVDDRLVVTAIVAQDDKYRSEVDGTVLAEQIQQIPHVKDVHVVSEQEAQRRFLRNVPNLQAPPQTWVFHEALEISVDDTQHLQGVRDQVIKLAGIQEATFLGELVKRLTAVTDYLKTIALWGTIFLSGIAVLVVMSVVRTAIHSERRSVQTMASVGGSTWTIAVPLLIHMLGIALISTTLASMVGFYIDPQIGSGFAGQIQNLPSWLQTGRAYGAFALWPAMFAGTGLACALIVAYGTRIYTRKA